MVLNRFFSIVGQRFAIVAWVATIYLSPRALGDVHVLDLTATASAPNLSRFTFGTAKNPAGVELTADGVSLMEDARRITPTMGEFHYARYPRGEWRDELLKMQAGGIDVVATYVFWIHHEEQKGQWDWSGDRDLRAFVSLCGELKLRCIVRCGPWCHGEVRNGGFPDWLVAERMKLRSNDARYLAAARALYGQIAAQVRGLLWKDGGPVIGVQIENEFWGSGPDHLITLKKIAVESGLDVPLYTRTGWPELRKPVPFGELIPLYGGYAEGFWDRELTTMPGHYWKQFVFKYVRTDSAIATDHFGSREAKDPPDVSNYPYLTCEIGPGMPSSYHRRITVFPTDALSMVIAKLGSGSNSPGYYMYHGGTNPAGREAWLQENQRSPHTNRNDLPVKSYDFQAPLGEFGQTREQYHLLRPVHLFLRDFGSRLAPMRVVLPDETATGRDDTTTFRWAVRTDGHSGFVFVNNYQRLLPQPARPHTQIKLKLADGELTFPRSPTTVAADHAYFWPFNFDLGDGILLQHATAQPVCQLRDGKTVYTVFAETGNPAEFAFAGQTDATGHAVQVEGDSAFVPHADAGTTPVVTLTAKNGVTHKVILLDEATAKTCYKGTVDGVPRLILTPAAAVMFDGGELRLSTEGSADLAMALLPAPPRLSIGGQTVSHKADGAFTRYALPVPQREPLKATAKLLRDAGPPREVKPGVAGVAEQPHDDDYQNAAVWQITLPPGTDPSRRLLLRVRYLGDVARAYAGDRLLTDNFYNGTPFDIGLYRYGHDPLAQGVTLKILPSPQSPLIYMLDRVRPAHTRDKPSVALQGVEVVESQELRLSVEP